MGQGCKKCGLIKRTLTKEQVIKQFKEIFGTKNDYSEINYINDSTKIKIRCLIHDHIFYMTPSNHKSGQDCVMCSKRKSFSDRDDLIKLCQEAHNNYYSYSLVIEEDIGYNKKIKIICPKHRNI